MSLFARLPLDAKKPLRHVLNKQVLTVVEEALLSMLSVSAANHGWQRMMAATFHCVQCRLCACSSRPLCTVTYLYQQLLVFIRQQLAG